MNRLVLNSFVAAGALAAVWSFNSPTYAMDDDIVQPYGSSPAVLRNPALDQKMEEIESLVCEGKLQNAQSMLEESFPKSLNAWERVLKTIFSDVEFDDFRKIDLASIQNFRAAFLKLFKEKEREISAYMAVLEATAIGLLSSEGSADLSRAHSLLNDHFDRIVTLGESIVFEFMDDVDFDPVYRLYKPLMDRMLNSGKFNIELLETILYKVFHMSYDQNKALFDKTEEYIKAIMAVLPAKATNGSSGESECSESSDDDDGPGIFLTCLHLYKQRSMSEIKQSLSDLKEIDLEEASIFLKALKYRGVKSLDGETIKLIQKLIIYGYESEMAQLEAMRHPIDGDAEFTVEIDSDPLADEYAEILAYESMLIELFESADTDQKTKFNEMMAYFKESAIQED